MKKIHFVLFLIICLLEACAAPNFILGTSESDFVTKCKRAVIVESSSAGKVYSVGDGIYTEKRFYYFQNGILIRLDAGVSRPDIRIDNYNHRN